jgi:L-ascorbate metabolism protein UlaG (beta-lactamase superfamily)
MVPIHYDTFFQPRHYERPFLERAIAHAKLGPRVRVLSIGESTEFVY